jgi:hypothetical protein
MNLSDFSEVPSIFQQEDISPQTAFDQAAASIVAFKPSGDAEQTGSVAGRSFASDNSLLDNFHMALHDEVCSMLSRACVQEGEPRTAALGKSAQAVWQRNSSNSHHHIVQRAYSSAFAHPLNVLLC